MVELIDKKLVLNDIASWAVGDNPEEPQKVSIDELTIAMGVSIGRLPTTTETEIRNKAIEEFAEKISLGISESLIWGILPVNCREGVSDDIVDYVIDTVKEIAEQMKEVE